MKSRLIAIVFLVAASLASCNTADKQQIVYQGLYADDTAGMNGLYNPERGFRLEVALDVTEKNDVWSPKEYPDITSYLEKESAIYESDSVSLVQTYFYLTGAVGKDLVADDFRSMSLFLDTLRGLGKKAVLRFAYETQFMGRAATGPTLEDIARHTEQLKPFLEANKDVIQVVQAGMIGAWGEWHSSFHGLEKSDDTKRTILQYICNMTPRNRCVQIRVPEYKNLLDSTSADYKRLSFHDDFIVINPHQWDGGMSEGTAAFNQIVQECPYLPVDGELPWGTWSMNEDADNPEAGWLVDGLQAAHQLFLQHYTSLSAIHNYKEKGTKDKYSMMYWKETPITPAFLQQHQMPFSPSYFQKRDGSEAERTVFDYIRDHLGYRLELQVLNTEKHFVRTKENRVELSLINRGFSTLFNEHPVYFVLINDSGEVCLETPINTDVYAWQPYAPHDTLYTPLVHTLVAGIELPASLKEGTYQLGLWIPDGSDRLKHNNRFAIRCANSESDWWVSDDGKYGVNILATVPVLGR